MIKLVLEKAEEPEIKLPTFVGSWKRQRISRKTPTSSSLTMLKPNLEAFEHDLSSMGEECKKCKEAKWLSEEAFQITEERREVKSKGKRERYTQ